MQTGHEGHVSAGIAQLPNPGSGLESIVAQGSGSGGASLMPPSGLEHSFANYQSIVTYLPYIALAAVGLYLVYGLIKYIRTNRKDIDHISAA